MPAGAFAVPIAGATIANVWKQRLNVSSGLPDDAGAPFALGTVSLITPVAGTSRVVAKFCRVGATGIAAGGTAGIGTDGVTTTAGAGNTWTNDTGVALVTGDYAWLTTGQTTTFAADELADVFATPEEKQELAAALEKETPEERKSRLEREAAETPKERKLREMTAIRELRKAKQDAADALAAKIKAEEEAAAVEAPTQYA